MFDSQQNHTALVDDDPESIEKRAKLKSVKEAISATELFKFQADSWDWAQNISDTRLNIEEAS